MAEPEGSMYAKEMAESAGKMYALATVLSILAVLAIILRFYARRIKRLPLSWDDYMILPALLFTIGTAICMFVGVAIGHLGQHTEIDIIGMPVIDHYLKVFEQITFASQLTQTLTFGFTKLSVLLFYRRIFNGRFISISVWTMIGIVTIWTVAFFFSNLFQCWPLPILWTGFGYTPDNCINTNAMYLGQAWSDVLTDIFILMLPVPSIWALQMPVKQRTGVAGIFLLGGLTVGAGIARLVVFNRIIAQTEEGFVDLTYINTPMVYWPMVESSMGIVGACLPLLRPLFVGASTKGFMRNLNSVKLPSSNESGEDWKDRGDVSPTGHGISFATFGSGSTIVPIDGEQYSPHNEYPKRDLRMEILDSRSFANEKGGFLQGIRRADDRV